MACKALFDAQIQMHENRPARAGYGHEFWRSFSHWLRIWQDGGGFDSGRW